MKLKKKRQRDRKKIRCFVCKTIFNSDYRLKHNSTNHQDFKKSNKNIQIEVFVEVFGALKNPFEIRNKKQKTNNDTNAYMYGCMYIYFASQKYTVTIIKDLQ